MYTTTDERGILNNFAAEPKISYAEYPSQEEQRRYAMQGGVATLLVGVLLLIAFSVS
ncbi:hypothetical protein Cri9333_4327 [Crinalium epipsammum PCC 9333]|uniref:Ssl1498 family light-harvesting-like protein n=1 Tax=Crinalium epipsammum PCC 9333 TaxID=1173022 RepID=K9W437_9CYAN|nr:ssl1498 family light-harvesting-like protein [Crinalium epipsammum]AFZ15113.1 hypothetical protein Cri9333_4327 [Crinalium epipsammum PCC 9333]